MSAKFKLGGAKHTCAPLDMNINLFVMCFVIYTVQNYYKRSCDNNRSIFGKGLEAKTQ